MRRWSSQCSWPGKVTTPSRQCISSFNVAIGLSADSWPLVKAAIPSNLLRRIRRGDIRAVRRVADGQFRHLAPDLAHVSSGPVILFVSRIPLYFSPRRFIAPNPAKNCAAILALADRFVANLAGAIAVTRCTAMTYVTRSPWNGPCKVFPMNIRI